jgi:steroid 5-alpha reductase family enzyme
MMPDLLGQTDVLTWTGVVTLVAVLSLWLISLLRRDASVVDPFWGPGFVLIAVTAYLVGSGFEPRRLLITGMVAIWGLRLGLHLLARNLHEGEDRRYRAMREHWGDSFWWVSLGTVFLLQGTLMWIISMPVQVATTAPGPPAFAFLDSVGVTFWGIGMFFEAVGDWQLRRFKADPANAGKVLDRGLWAYTRHPNYFGDAMVWWGIFFVAAAVRGGWLTVFGPLLMTFFLIKISGVAMLERDIGERRPEYRDYIERTSAFVPWPPKPRTTDGRAGSER